MNIDTTDIKNMFDNKFDKSNWVKWKFSDLVENIVEKVTPSESGLEYYIGLKHLDTGSLKIRRYGKCSEVSGDKLRAYKGDLIFAKRNSYLKRVAIIDFDAVASAHSLVLRAKHENINPDLLPFFLMSENFWTRAIEISVGSLSPTINWSVLAKQEFLLPPKDQQYQLAELLWKVDAIKQSYLNLESNLNSYYTTVIDNLFSAVNKKWKYVPLSSIAHINQDSLNSKTDSNYEFKYLDLTSIEGPKLLANMNIIRYGDAPSRAKRIVKDDSIVIGLVRPYQQSIIHLEKAHNIVSSTGTAVIDAKKEINSRFLFHQLFSQKFLRFCERMMTGTNYPAITPNDLALYKVAIPESRLIQDEIAKKLDLIEKNQKENLNVIKSSFELQKSIINQVF